MRLQKIHFFLVHIACPPRGEAVFYVPDRNRRGHGLSMLYRRPSPSGVLLTYVLSIFLSAELRTRNLSLRYAPHLFVFSGFSPSRQGYFRTAASVARVRSSPRCRDECCASFVMIRKLCALPSKPSIPAPARLFNSSSAICPKGGCPRSCA